MAASKRPHSDSDSEGESPSAKRHNGTGEQHDEEGKHSPPPQDNISSKQSENADEASASSTPASKKRERADSTDLPDAKRSANQSTTTKPSTNQSKPSYDHSYGIKLHTKVRNCKTSTDCGNILNNIPACNLIALAIALNDAKEEHRLNLLGMLPKSLVSQIVDVLANAYMDKSRYDPNPCSLPWL